MSTPHPIMLARRLVILMERSRINITTEIAAQADIARLLDAEGLEYKAEAVLSDADRIDFLVGSVGIEVKASVARRRLVMKQVCRYVESDKIGALILTTAAPFPAGAFAGTAKPVFVASLANGWIG